MSDWNTLSVHAGEQFEPSSGVAAAIYPTSTWIYEEPETLAEVANLSQPPQFYNRYGSPNTQQVESAVASLCGAEAALASASGMSAISTVFLGMLQAGDHIIAQNQHYPMSSKIMTHWLPRLGITATLVDQVDIEAFAQAIRPNTRMIYLETPSNPTLQLTDLAAIVELAQAHQLITVTDNTFATPYNQRTLSFGIDIEVHSATKFMGGHSDVGAGVVASKKEVIERLFETHKWLGPTLHAQEAWLLRRGLQTFGLRMAQHNRNALAVAQFLESHPAVSRVHYPGLPSHPQHALAQRQMVNGYGGMVAFELVGGREAGLQLLRSAELIKHAVSLGGVHSLITHPASTIAAPLTDAQLANAGITPGLVRLAVGIEDSADLIAELDRQLVESSTNTVK